ncbi:MAG TPA: hypothetical protein VG273_05740 [Bryobacteraceae bacterium]|jgi:hypothetical protein|nr:hypothetical protein [Bryobacteraceae bacterium]
MKKNLLLSAAIFGLMGLAACSSQPAPTEAKTDTKAAEKKPAGPPEPVTAKTAYYEMYTPAHAWAPDLLPLSLVSGEVQGVKNADGKFGFWTAVFASPSLHQARTYTYSVADQLPNIQKGVKAEGTEAWAGPTQAQMTFQNSDFTIDSDAAYKIAAEKAADFLKEHPDKAVSFTLGAAHRFPSPVWYIIWGDAKSGYAVYLSASSGSIMK